MPIFGFFGGNFSWLARKKRLAARGSRLGLAGSQNSLPHPRLCWNASAINDLHYQGYIGNSVKIARALISQMQIELIYKYHEGLYNR